MGRTPSQTVNAEINRLRRYLEDNLDKSDEQIILELGIKRRRFYLYKERIREQDKAAWHEMAKETLEERNSKIMKAIDFAQKVNKEIAEKSPDHRARIEAAKQVIQNNVWAKELLEMGPKIMPKLEAKVLTITNESEIQDLEPIREPPIS
jgi:hypothetical protein